MSTSADAMESRSASVASGRIHNRRWTMPTASNAASPCRAARIFVISTNTSRKNEPFDNARTFPRAASGSIIASNAAVDVLSDPRHKRGCSSTTISSSSSSSSSSFASEDSASERVASSAASRRRADSRVLAAAISVLTARKRSRSMPSHRGWFTRESMGSFTPSSLASSSWSSSSLGLWRSSSRGSRAAAARDRLCARISASSRLEASRSGWSRAARMSATWCTTRSAAGCWRMTRQWRSRRWERCARRSRCASTNARSEAPPSRDASASAATASKISVRHARAAASSASVSSSLSGAEAPRGVGSREASPVEVTGAPSGAADAGSLGANPDRRSTSPEGTFTPRASSAAGTEAPSEPARATGSLNGLALKRFPTQQKPAHTSRGGPIALGYAGRLLDCSTAPG